MAVFSVILLLLPVNTGGGGRQAKSANCRPYRPEPFERPSQLPVSFVRVLHKCRLHCESADFKTTVAGVDFRSKSSESASRAGGKSLREAQAGPSVSGRLGRGKITHVISSLGVKQEREDVGKCGGEGGRRA